MRLLWSAYGRLYDRLWDTHLIAELGGAVAARAAAAGLPVVEVGCGTGLITRHLVETGLAIEAHEPSEVMRRRCEARVSPLPVGDAALDAVAAGPGPRFVVASNVVHFTDDPEAALERLRHLAGEGGGVVVVTPLPSATLADVVSAHRRHGATAGHAALFVAQHLEPLDHAAAFACVRDDHYETIAGCFALVSVDGEAAPAERGVAVAGSGPRRRGDQEHDHRRGGDQCRQAHEEVQRCG